MSEKTMITELTPEQEAMMPVWVEKWVKIGTCTDQNVDGEACFKAVQKLYDTDEFREHTPSKWQIVDSPRAIYEITRDADFINRSCFGAFEASWLSYYTFFRDVVHIDIDDRLGALETLALNVSLYYTHNDTVIFARKPVRIVMRNGSLHNESGPAIEFADGFSVWNIDGNQVNEQIVMRPETLTVEQVDAETNNDIQSIMLSRFGGVNPDGSARPNIGWSRYIRESNAKLIHSRENDVDNMIELLYDTEKQGRRLVVTCPTGRMFVLGVQTSAETRTCEGAQHWLAGGRRNRRCIART
jgi:hypothetical protein